MSNLSEIQKTFSMTHFRRHQEAIFNEIADTGQSVVITRYGKPFLVLLPQATYEQLAAQADKPS